MTLEQLLQAKGYTEQDITDIRPLLDNAKFRATLEAELTNGEKAAHDLDEYDRWFTNEITPEHQRLLDEKARAVADVAAAQARFEEYRKQTMKIQGRQQAPEVPQQEPATPPPAAADGKIDPRYVSNEVFQGAYQLTGKAIAQAIDITTQHMQLFPGQFLNMEQLRDEAMNAKKSVKEFWEQKYNVAGKRAETAAKAKADEEAAIRADERRKMAVEFGGSNPNLQIGAQSNNPFVVRKQPKEGKQPWERNDNERASDRITKAVEKAASRGELARA